MSKIKRYAIAIAVGLGLVSGASAAEINVGILLPITGQAGHYGQLFGKAVELAVDHINEDKWLKQKVVFRYEDSQALPQPAVIGMRKLLDLYDSPYILTGYTGVSKAVAPIAANKKAVVVNGGGASPDLANLGDYFWNIIPLATNELSALLPYLVEEKKAKRFALVYVDDPLGQAIQKLLKESLPSLGAEYVGDLSIDPTDQQFSAIATRIRAYKPDVVYLASYGNQMLQLVQQLRNNGVKARFASYSAFGGVSDFADLPAARGSVITTPVIDLKTNDAVTDRFLRDFPKKSGEAPNYYIATYYNATRIFGELAKGLEEKGLPINGENLLKEFDSRLGTSYDLVGGPLTFDKNRVAKIPVEIREYTENGVVTRKR